MLGSHWRELLIGPSVLAITRVSERRNCSCNASTDRRPVGPTSTGLAVSEAPNSYF